MISNHDMGLQYSALVANRNSLYITSSWKETYV
jgi:hypothetical protein